MGALAVGAPLRRSSTPARRCWSPTPRASGSGWAAPGAACRGPRSRRVEHRPRRGVLRDGRLVLVAAQPRAACSASSTPAGRRHAALTERLYGAPFAVPLGLDHAGCSAPAAATCEPGALAADREPTAELRDRRGGVAGARPTTTRRDAGPRCPPRLAELDGRGVTPTATHADAGRPRGASTTTQPRRVVDAAGRLAAAIESPAPTPSPLARAVRGPRSGARRSDAATRLRSPERDAGSSTCEDPGGAPERPTRDRGPSIDDLAASSRPSTRSSAPSWRPPATGSALRRPARRAHPDPPARHRVDRGRRLRAVRRRLLRPRPPAHPGPGARASTWRRCWRPTTSATPTRPIDPRRVFEAELATGGRLDPRHPRRPELVGAGRRRDGAGAGLVGRPAGDGRPGRGVADAAVPQRLRRPDQRRAAGRDAGPGRAHRGRRRRPRRGPRRHRARSSSPATLAFGQSRDARRSRRRSGSSPPTARSQVTVDGQDHGAHRRDRPARARTYVVS